LRFFRKLFKKRFREDADFEQTWVEGRSPIRIGAYTYGVKNLVILQWNEAAALTVGKFCSLAADITIFLGGNHRTDWITTFPFGHVFETKLGAHDIKGHPSTRGNVWIGNDVWIGAGAKIMSGVTIGNGAVIAASALVTRDVSPYSIVGGNPAQVISVRFTPETIALLQTLRWWDLQPSTLRAIAPRLSRAPQDHELRQLIDEHAAELGRLTVS
jgi:acetyltransferase-like isoleucine patch superfamily enzyme